jgi:glycosyltransferase involved in cell wall biosynthesis
VSRPLRLLFVSRRYWPAVGGVETFLRHLVRGLAERHDVTVLAQRVDDGPTERLTDSLRPPPSFEPFLDGAARIEPLRISLPRRMRMAPLVTQVVPGLRRYAYGSARVTAAKLYAQVVAPEIGRHVRGLDAVHMFGGDLVAAATLRAARSARVPGVVTPFAHAGQYGVGPADLFAYDTADRVVALLEDDASVYRRLGVPGDRIETCGVCSPGVPAGRGAEIRRRYGIDGPLVLFLGVRREYKGYDLLLEAAPTVAASVPGVTFAFAGPGPSVAPPPGVRVVDAGFVDDDERAGWLEAADLLCLPSEAEIFPLSVLEAWSVGTPVVTSDLPPLVELLARSHGGLTAAREPHALASTISALLADPARAAALGQAGCEFWLRECTVDAVIARHVRLYEELLESEDARCAA